MSAEVSGTGHSSCAAARAWCCPASRVQGWRHAGRLGMLAGSNVGWALAAANHAGVVVGLRDREMGQGGMAAPGGCVQSRSVGGPSSMGPPSSSVRSTTEVFRLVMLGGREKSTTVGTRKSNDEC